MDNSKEIGQTLSIGNANNFDGRKSKITQIQNIPHLGSPSISSNKGMVHS